MKERLELIMQEEGNLSAYEFSKTLGFKRPDNLYKILDGSTMNPGIEFVRAVKKNFNRYSYDWIIDGVGEKYTDIYGNDLKISKDKDNKILQLEKMLSETDAKIFRYENIIDALTGNGKK